MLILRTSGAKLIIDAREISPGKVLTTKWNGLPIFVRNRTLEQVKSAQKVKLLTFKDKLARNDNLRHNALAFDVNRCFDRSNQNWLVLMASCPHLGCVPEAKSDG